MQLVSAEFVSQGELELRSLLEAYPVLRQEMTLLLNSFRELVSLTLDGEADPSDTLRSLAKKEGRMLRLGLPLLETAEDWMNARKGDLP